MRKLVLNFVGDEQVELFESCFIHPLLEEERRCIRGKRSGAFRGYSTFQWTRAVQALSVLVVEGAIRAIEPSPLPTPLLLGGSGSLASSLDYAIDKQTTWLFDMFGWNAAGSGMSRRLFMRSNPGQRIPGPVAVSINLNVLSLEEIEILLNYQPVTTLEGLRHLRERISSHSTAALSSTKREVSVDSRVDSDSGNSTETDTSIRSSNYSAPPSSTPKRARAPREATSSLRSTRAKAQRASATAAAAAEIAAEAA